MNELESMKILHQRSVKGEILSVDEESALQNWYKTLDSEENKVINNSQIIQSSDELRKNLANNTNQVVKIIGEIKTLLSQNEKLRKENQALKKSLEAQLLEKVA